MGVAVKVTVLPGQQRVSEAVIEIPAGVPVSNRIRMGFEVTGLGVPHERPEVMLHVTKSPSKGT